MGVPAVPDLEPEKDGEDDGTNDNVVKLAVDEAKTNDGAEKKAAAELRDMLRRQAAEIEELERRLLDAGGGEPVATTTPRS